jgi:hypothetical protein
MTLGNLSIKLCDAVHHGHFGYKNHYLWEISGSSYVMLYIMAILDTKSLPLGNLQVKLCDALHHGHFGYKNHYLWEISRLIYVMLYIMAILHYHWVSTKSPSWARFRTQNHHFSISKFSLSQNRGTNKDLKLHLSELKTVLCCLFVS